VSQVSEYFRGVDLAPSTRGNTRVGIGHSASAGAALTTVPYAWSRSFPATPDQVRETRQFLKQLLGDWPRSDDALVCLSELVSNSVLHSNSCRPGGYVAVHVSMWPGVLHIEVEDEGGAWGHLHDRGDHSGRGLIIVEELADDWSIVGNGTGSRTVWFQISCP
jgi:anti-sigma regulatory factor (Ser/Thr protein kinase)